MLMNGSKASSAWEVGVERLLDTIKVEGQGIDVQSRLLAAEQLVQQQGLQLQAAQQQLESHAAELEATTAASAVAW